MLYIPIYPIIFNMSSVQWSIFILYSFFSIGGLPDCDFEHDGCGWKDEDDEEFMFIRAQGQDNNGTNGPDSDHDGGKTSMNIVF